jgi:hypothetical protein
MVNKLVTLLWTPLVDSAGEEVWTSPYLSVDTAVKLLWRAEIFGG